MPSFDAKSEARKIEELAKSALAEESGEYSVEYKLMDELRSLSAEQAKAVRNQLGWDNLKPFSGLPNVFLSEDGKELYFSLGLTNNPFENFQRKKLTLKEAGADLAFRRLPNSVRGSGWEQVKLPKK